ncbi:MAG: hypothetical protein ACO20R_09865 [Burkholderiaceae bacterium]
MATLVMCFGMMMGNCTNIQQFAYPSMDECRQERQFVVANRTQHFVFAVCRSGEPAQKAEAAN